jgi:hypothetical protein
MEVGSLNDEAKTLSIQKGSQFFTVNFQEPVRADLTPEPLSKLRGNMIHAMFERGESQAPSPSSSTSGERNMERAGGEVIDNLSCEYLIPPLLKGG